MRDLMREMVRFLPQCDNIFPLHHLLEFEQDAIDKWSGTTSDGIAGIAPSSCPLGGSWGTTSGIRVANLGYIISPVAG